MKMIFVAFARPRGLYASVLNRAAAFLTRGQYCHCELAVSWTEEQMQTFLGEVSGWERLRMYKHSSDGRVLLSFYSNLGDRVNFKFLSKTHIDPFYCVYDDAWDQIPMKYSFEEEKKIVRFLLDQVGSPYDLAGAWLFFVPWRRERKSYGKYFCSQLVACALNHSGKALPNPGSLSPNGLYKYLLH